MSGVTIHEMQSFAESMADTEIRLATDIGNVIDLGGEELGDDLGFNLLTNSRSGGSGGGGGGGVGGRSSGKTVHVSGGGSNLAATDFNLEPLEPISLDIPIGGMSDGHRGGGGFGELPDISVTRDGGGGGGAFFDDNTQTATGPGISLSAPKRLSAEEERRQKADLINKLSRLESKGFQVSKRFTMDNSLDEIQSEFDRLMDARNLEASLKFQRQMMMGVVTGLELMNNKFNPFDWQLEGWSESVHENVDDFDEVFEELYDKYKTKGNMPPEARMLFMLVGSGFMFHMSNSFFKSKVGGMTVDDLLKSNPALAKQMAAAAAQAAGPGFGNFMGAAMGVPPGMGGGMPMGMGGGMPMGMGGGMGGGMPMGMGGGMGGMGGMGAMGGAGVPYSTPAPPVSGPPAGPGAFFNSSAAHGPPSRGPQSVTAAASAPVRREMKGPSGVDDILKTFAEVRQAEMEVGPGMFAPPPSMGAPGIPMAMGSPARQAAAELQSLHSEESQSQAGSAVTGRTSGGGRRRKPQMPAGNVMTLNV